MPPFFSLFCLNPDGLLVVLTFEPSFSAKEGIFGWNRQWLFRGEVGN